MKRNVLLAVIATALLASASSAPAWAAAPFGSFGGKVGGGNSGGGMLPLFGWALDDNGVERVDILVDGVVVGGASYGRSRPQVTRRFPGYPDSAASGFAYELDTTHYLNGLHTISARIKSRAGEYAMLNARTFQFSNVQHNLAPFGKIELPNRGAEMRGNCGAGPHRYSVVSGYAMDVGVQDYDTGVAWVELMIDREIWANSRTSCRFSPIEGGLSDCYGLRRLDLEPIFPNVKDAPHSGFRFVLDVGGLIATGLYTPGSHLLSIRAGDHAGQSKEIAEIAVTFTCDEFLGNENSFGEVGVPRIGMLHHGVIQAAGWALDWEGIHHIVIMVDSVPVGTATLGAARPQVSLDYPGYPQSAAPGWSFPLDTRQFANGEHLLEALVVDSTFRETYIGARRFIISNPVP
jgi:N-acetylmuramoyl-L-alanine amidase